MEKTRFIYSVCGRFFNSNDVTHIAMKCYCKNCYIPAIHILKQENKPKEDYSILAIFAKFILSAILGFFTYMVLFWMPLFWANEHYSSPWLAILAIRTISSPIQEYLIFAIPLAFGIAGIFLFNKSLDLARRISEWGLGWTGIIHREYKK